MDEEPDANSEQNLPSTLTLLNLANEVNESEAVIGTPVNSPCSSVDFFDARAEFEKKSFEAEMAQAMAQSRLEEEQRQNEEGRDPQAASSSSGSAMAGSSVGQAGSDATNAAGSLAPPVQPVQELYPVGCYLRLLHLTGCTHSTAGDSSADPPQSKKTRSRPKRGAEVCVVAACSTSGGPPIIILGGGQPEPPSTFNGFHEEDRCYRAWCHLILVLYAHLCSFWSQQDLILLGCNKWGGVGVPLFLHTLCSILSPHTTCAPRNRVHHARLMCFIGSDGQHYFETNVTRMQHIVGHCIQCGQNYIIWHNGQWWKVFQVFLEDNSRCFHHVSDSCTRGSNCNQPHGRSGHESSESLQNELAQVLMCFLREAPPVRRPRALDVEFIYVYVGMPPASMNDQVSEVNGQPAAAHVPEATLAAHEEDENADIDGVPEASGAPVSGSEEGAKPVNDPDVSENERLATE